MNLFATPAEAARALAVNKATIYRWIDAGEIPFVRIGGTLRIPRRWLDSLAGSTPCGGSGSL